jgi:integrase
MNTNFSSKFADRLVKFLEQKQALGYSYNGSISDLRIFDRMCAERFPDENELTADICNAWATRRNTESNKTINRRLPFIREFARYLIRSGETAYVLPNGTVKPGQRYIPHIYSHSEISLIWHTFDSIAPTKSYPAAHIIMPTLIRLLYCCGLRPGEVLCLKVEDADLDRGILFIAESKGHKDRIIVLADDVLEMCRNFNKKMEEYFPNRAFFFAKNSADSCNHQWVSDIFRKKIDTLNIKSNSGKLLRLYDLRHTFATHRLYQWMRDGKDLYTMLPYLSAYMGHAGITETLYYIHLAPGMFESMSGWKYESASHLFPKAVEDDE